MITIRLPRIAYVNRQLQVNLEDHHVAAEDHLHRVLCIQAASDGVVWRGLQPLLFEAPPSIARRALKLLIRHFRAAIIQTNLIVTDHEDTMLLRQVPTKESIDICILILPPQVTSIERTFAGLLLCYEHLWLTLQSLSAWIATLGGGYFLCRHLGTAVVLARKQRSLALWMGDYETADRCTLNEAFNYIHAGMFRIARRMINAVRETTTRRNDTLTLRMVMAATLFLSRVKRAHKFAREKDDTIDDYQRIRITHDRSI